ncbi:MAG: hypothetical protein WBA13_18215 [Microcoleaceae cyanobacterium]
MTFEKYQPTEIYEAYEETLVLSVVGPSGYTQVLAEQTIKFIGFKGNFSVCDTVEITTNEGQVSVKLNPDFVNNLRNYVEKNDASNQY